MTGEKEHQNFSWEYDIPALLKKGRIGGSSQVRKGLKCQDVWDGGQAGYKQLSWSDKESRAVGRKNDGLEWV